MERTLIILKPDAIQRRLIGRLIQRFEEKGLAAVGLKLMRIPRDLAERHYAPHKGKPFYSGLIDYITSGPVVVMVLQGDNAIKQNRDLMGQTDPAKAEAGTIRKAHGTNIEFNAVHGSDSPETAQFEISYFFPRMEIFE